MRSINLSVLNIAFILLITGCGPNIEKIKYTLTIDKGGKGTARFDYLNIKPSTEGKKGEKEIEGLIKDVKEGKYDFFKDLGLINRKQTISYDKNGILNGSAYGEFKDIFTFVKLIDSSSPHRLRKNQILKINWSNNILKIELNGNLNNEETKKNKDKSNSLFIFKTTGKFLDGTVGKISKDRKTTTIDDTSENKLLLIIEGLAE
jgi:hypothetical protein